MSLAEFMDEAERMKTLFHENIVQLYAVCKKPTPVIVMEYLEKGSLLAHLKVNRKALKEPGLRKLAGQVASGMDYMETKGFIHRDLAARNVLVSAEGVAKVADFGMSRLVQATSTSAVYKAQDKQLFPIRWTAPESIETGAYTSKSDVWSFGILLTEIITFGEVPYTELKRNDDVIQKVRGGYRMPCPQDCPDDWYAIMQKCWQADFKARPSFAELKATLQGADQADGRATAGRRKPSPKISSLIGLMFGDEEVQYKG